MRWTQPVGRMSPTLPFSGPALPLKPDDIARAAKTLGVPAAAVQAVVTVETGGAGGFLSDGTGRPRLLFEAHKFGAATGGRWNVSHPHISTRSWDATLYQGGAAEYGRLAEAMALDRRAAMESASWGMFQILGSNFEVCGFGGVDSFVTGMLISEGAHLATFVRYCQAEGLDAPLRDLDWATFARRYNGPSYAANRYDTKLAAAYRLALGIPVDGGARLGSKGGQVQRIQVALNAAIDVDLITDGIFGRVTELALLRFQRGRGLSTTGTADDATMRALGLH